MKYVAQQRVYLTKKEGTLIKPFAKQTDAFTVLNFRTQRVEKTNRKANNDDYNNF